MSRNQDDHLFAFIVGLLFGVANGVLLGLLIAPKSGQEIQRDVQGVFRKLPGLLSDELHNPESRSRGFFHKTRLTIENRVDQAKKAKEAGKMAEAKKREELATGYDYS